VKLELPLKLCKSNMKFIINLPSETRTAPQTLQVKHEIYYQFAEYNSNRPSNSASQNMKFIINLPSETRTAPQTLQVKQVIY